MRYHDLVNPYHLKLASADTSGTVLIWDVSQASVRSTLSEPDRSLLELGWLAGGANSLLLVLYSLGTVVLWQADTATPLWRKCYAEPLVAFALDPFCDASVTCKQDLCRAGALVLRGCFISLCSLLPAHCVGPGSATGPCWIRDQVVAGPGRTPPQSHPHGGEVLDAC